MAKVGKYMGWALFNANTAKNPLYWAMRGTNVKSHTMMHTSLVSLKREIRGKEGK